MRFCEVADLLRGVSSLWVKEIKAGAQVSLHLTEATSICTEEKHKEAKGLQRRPSFHILNGSLTTFPTLWREPSEHVT